jgi:hypothetical protein
MRIVACALAALVLLAAAAGPALGKEKENGNGKGGSKDKGGRKLKHSRSGENMFIVFDAFALEVRGNKNVPKYTLWKLDDEADTDDDAEKEQKKAAKADSVKSKVSFNNVFESSLADEVAGKDGQVSLASLDWTFSDVTEFGDGSDSGIRFAMTGIGKGVHIEFHNTIGGPAGEKCSSTVAVNGSGTVPVESDCPAPFSLKFDVVVREYRWHSASSRSLVLTWSTEKGDDSNLEFASADEAFWYDPADAISRQRVDVTFLNQDQKKSTIVYPRGPEGWTLIHDPVVGIAPQFPVWAIAIIAVAAFLVVSGFVAGTALLIVRSRKKSKVSQSPR